MALAYRSTQEKGLRPWELPRRKLSTMEGTLFYLKYLTIIIDELHVMRNLGLKYFSGLRLFDQGLLKLGLTGTPLLTLTRVSLLSSWRQHCSLTSPLSGCCCDGASHWRTSLPDRSVMDRRKRRQFELQKSKKARRRRPVAQIGPDRSGYQNAKAILWTHPSTNSK